jgi:pimeloyl-ACP methyl ester carboxylesterase
MPAFPASTSSPSQRDAVLCIHGSAVSGRSWNPIAAVLGDRFDVAMPDRLGCERGVGWPTGLAASFESEAQHLGCQLGRHPGGVHVLAHSYGAAIALELALRWPQRVRSLTLFEPARFALLFHDAGSSAQCDEILRVGGGVSQRARAGRTDEAAAMFVDYWSGAGAWAALDDRQRGGVRACMPKVAAEFDAAFADRTPLRRFSALAMPLCLMRGDASPAPVRRIVDLLAGLVPGAEVVDVAGIGHMAPVTQPGAVVDHLPHWLRAEDWRLAA